MTKIGIGVMGSGEKAFWHSHSISLNPNFYISSLWARDRSKRKEFSRIHHIDTICDDIEYLLEDDETDGVVMALPEEATTSIFSYVESFNKIMILTYPFTENEELCEKIIESIECGSYIFYANSFLYHPLIRSYLLKDNLPLFSASLTTYDISLYRIVLEVFIFLYGEIVEERIEKRGQEIVIKVKSKRGEGKISVYLSTHFSLSLTIGDESLELKAFSSLSSFYSHLLTSLEEGLENKREVSSYYSALLFDKRNRDYIYGK